MPRRRNRDDPYVNLLDPEFYVDPFDAYRWLRDESPVHWDPVQQLWGISRHADVMAVENDAGAATARSTGPAPTPTSATTRR